MAAVLVKAQPGMVGFYSGRPMGAASDEFVMVTVWDNLASLQAFAGTDWNRSVIPEPERPLLAESSVQHYDLIAGGGVQSFK